MARLILTKRLRWTQLESADNTRGTKLVIRVVIIKSLDKEEPTMAWQSYWSSEAIRTSIQQLVAVHSMSGHHGSNLYWFGFSLQKAVTLLYGRNIQNWFWCKLTLATYNNFVMYWNLMYLNKFSFSTSIFYWIFLSLRYWYFILVWGKKIKCCNSNYFRIKW